MAFESKYMSVEQYLRKISGQEKETLIVDHNYVKPWNAHPDSHRTKPARLLFMKGLQRYPQLSSVSNQGEEIDVETCDESLPSPFDNQRAKALANECERNLKYSSHFSDVEREEEELDLNTCSSNQRKLYQQIINVLNAERLAKLTYSGTTNEPLKRRIATDKASRQIRQIFGMVFWDIELLSWLHKKLLKQSFPVLSSYINILQTLRVKVPSLVDRILQACTGFPANDAVVQIMKRPWDPVLPILSQNKPKKLPGNPIILLCPSSHNQQLFNTRSQRLRFWHSNLSSLCKVMNVPVISDDGKMPTTFEEALEQIMSSVRNKVNELKNHYPNRPLILLGWLIGGLIACHIALEAPIDAVISLGFPLTGVNGSRGDLNDPLLDSKVPTLFVVGQCASMCSTDDIEDFRSRMRADTSLIILGGADDMLRMSPLKMKQECITQPIVDRCLLDEISDFLTTVVVKMPSASGSTSVISTKPCTPIMEEEPEQIDDEWKPEDEGKRKRRKPREYSPELSPVRKRARHYTPKQVSSAAHKTRLSPSSSESSSSGSYVNEKSRSSKTVKKLSEKRTGRSSMSNWRKRQASKALHQASKSHHATRESVLPLSQINRFEDEEEPVQKHSSASKEISFSKNLLAKKNDPVDVEKAFGRDSSFLPRPLTPPEPEDTVSAEETEEALAELEAMSKEASAQAEIQSACAGILDHAPASREVTFSTVLDQPLKMAMSEGAKTSPVSPIASSDQKTPLAVSVTPGKQTVFPQSKFFSSTPLSTLKSSTSVSLLTSNQSSTAPSSKSTVITVPSQSAATILVSNSALQGTQPTKMIQLLSKNSLMTKTQKTDSSVSGGGESSQPQSCNLSLLSDVAGMSEQYSNRKPETHSSSSATLVKLSAPEKAQFPPMKCLKVVKAVCTPSPPARIETAEEMMEKQLAIQALNKSIGIDTPSTSKESGYSICYTTADGTVVSHTITRPNNPASVPKNAFTANRGRGRGRNTFSGNQYRFFDG